LYGILSSFFLNYLIKGVGVKITYTHLILIYSLPIRQLLPHRAVAQAGADESAAESSLGAGHIDAGEPFQSNRVIDEYCIHVGVGAQL